MPGEGKQRGIRAAIALDVVALAALVGMVVSGIRRTPRSANQPAITRPIAAPLRQERAPLDGLPGDRRGWGRPQPEHRVKPTYWPMVTALGITVAFWGVVNTLFLTWIGTVVLIYSLANWIGELRHDR